MPACRPAWDAAPRDFDFEAQMARELGIHPVIAGVMRRRGITTPDHARRFLHPDLADLHDPFLLPDMDIAARRIVKAIENHETVLVHGDYDVDGITGSALMVRFLSKLGADVQYHLPHRQIDHYGLSVEAMREAARVGAHLAIAVDCGVTGFEAVAEGRRLGMDVVVIDHHEPEDRLPNANAIVDPKRADSTYPERDLASVGLCFKTASAVCTLMDVPQESLQRAFLDLVAMGTIADVVPLIGENRILASHGLRSMAGTRKVGLQALMRLCNADGDIRASDVAFRIAPRMNAAGRMGDATDALELLLTNDPETATRLALSLDNANRERQRVQERIYRDALEMIEGEVDFENEHVVVLASPEWHVGVVGIVASKIMETHSRPTILMVQENGEARGSARSVHGFDISQALQGCTDLLLSHGGHALAAGMSLRIENLPDFRRRLNCLAAESLRLEDLQPRLETDAEVLLDEVDAELLEGLAQLEPFGQANPAPLFVTHGVDVLDVRTVGRDNQHLKLFVSQGDRPVDCIGFGMGPEADWIDRGSTIDICHTPEINEYNGTRGVQLRLQAVRAAR
ncbi:MAG: single-stranded-DNA-specific exonuclease RecJ [Armatimonadetes bacterium]|nr:single-stranded-DNA-specific exonuclease RecJ [Armatimonadota bacterium]